MKTPKCTSRTCILQLILTKTSYHPYILDLRNLEVLEVKDSSKWQNDSNKQRWPYVWLYNLLFNCSCCVLSLLFNFKIKLEWYIYIRKNTLFHLMPQKGRLSENSIKTFFLFHSPMKHQISYQEDTQYRFPPESSTAMLRQNRSHSRFTKSIYRF